MCSDSLRFIVFKSDILWFNTFLMKNLINEFEINKNQIIQNLSWGAWTVKFEGLLIYT